MTLTPRFDAGLAYASRLHATQRRKGSDVPYIAHLFGVASLALEMGATEDQAIAALLRDAVEDQGVTVAEIAEQWGEAVARIVADCTDTLDGDRGGWRARKAAYLAALPDKPATSLLVSLAEKTYNARAIVDDLRIHGEALWTRFSGGREALWYYRALADVFTVELPGAGADRFAVIVNDMHRLASNGTE